MTIVGSTGSGSTSVLGLRGQMILGSNVFTWVGKSLRELIGMPLGCMPQGPVSRN